MVQAIFFDIDGTLVSTKGKTYSDSTKTALKKLHEKGIYVFVASGRHKTEIKDEHMLDNLYFDGYVTLNGQYCYNEKEVIYENEIPKEDIKNIIKQVELNPYPCRFIEKDITYINMINQDVMEAQNAVHSALPPVMDIHRALENPVYQMIFYLDDEKARNYPLSVLKHSIGTRWNPYAMDIIPKNGSKKEGIQKVLDYYKISLKDTMAFGDGDNDIEMLKYVNIGIAMGNAEEKVKKVADFITDDVDDDGILHALEHYHLL